jgi:hypothetical protein
VIARVAARVAVGFDHAWVGLEVSYATCGMPEYAEAIPK